jgi:hypothetical protein
MSPTTTGERGRRREVVGLVGFVAAAPVFKALSLNQPPFPHGAASNRYDDDWGYNRLIANDDHFEVANVVCGYSVAFVLQCFLVFFALVQAWVYVQVHRTAPNVGDGVGIFLVKARGEGVQMHVRGPATAVGAKGKHTVYKVTKKGEASDRGRVAGPPAAHGASRSGGAGAKPKSAADRRESLTAARATPKPKSTDKSYSAYAHDAGKYGEDDEDYV